jgi:F-type H+-transporting ATPase subunit a
MFAETAFDHVLDTPHWHIFEKVGFHLPLGLTKYMILTLVAALLIMAIYIPLAKNVQSGAPPRGRWWNAFECLLEFIRDQVAKPYMGHDADRYVPFLWTLFLFILFCNLLGMFPFMGSPTASFSVTLALAIIAFCFIHGSAIAKLGVVHYFKSYIPNVEVPFGMGYAIIPMIVAIEIMGNFIKAFVLAVRLFANMFAGHMVLAFILLFIVMVRDAGPVLFWGVTGASVLGVTALSLLELFVAFLQAYIFTFLTALFLGSALHPEH